MFDVKQKRIMLFVRKNCAQDEKFFQHPRPDAHLTSFSTHEVTPHFLTSQMEIVRDIINGYLHPNELQNVAGKN